MDKPILSDALIAYQSLDHGQRANLTDHLTVVWNRWRQPDADRRWRYSNRIGSVRLLAEDFAAAVAISESDAIELVREVNGDSWPMVAAQLIIDFARDLGREERAA